jgi:hypothetical protein
MDAWIGVDLDGTLAYYYGWQNGGIGEPIPIMMERVLAWLDEGLTVKCMTARASVPEEAKRVRDWLDAHGLQALEVTNVKDFGMIELWDDRAIAVEHNTGVVLGGERR